MPYIHNFGEMPSSEAELRQLLGLPVEERSSPINHSRETSRESGGTSYEADESAEEAQDSDEDPLRRRLVRATFNNLFNVPMPPDGRSLRPPQADDWSAAPTVELAPIQPVPAQRPLPSFQAEYEAYTAQYAAQQPQYGYDYAPDQNIQYIRGHAYQGYPEPSPFAWSPSGMHHTLEAIGYRAPVLPHRDIQLGPRLDPTYDSYRYPVLQFGPYYPPASPTKASKDTTNIAFSNWYADRVTDLLVKPGQYRPGVGGSSDELWGVIGREKEAFHRVGRPGHHYPKQWGRMGLSETPPPGSRAVRQRLPETEPFDPWNVLWSNQVGRSSTLVAFIHDMLTRMTFSPTAVVTAVWYLSGLGLHEGDGRKGSELRDFLKNQRWSDLEGVEKRIATLGLLLAGKWLDDNSFLTKSWVEVTSIPVQQIDQMERLALADYHFSLYLPTSAWADHVNNLYTSLLYRNARDEVENVVLESLDEMVTEARELELADHKGRYTPAYDRPVSSARELPAAGEQAATRDWGEFVRSYAINESPAARASWDAALAEEHARAEEAALALLDEVEALDDQEEDEFLDYDGAKPWLPSISEMRRSASDASAKSFDSVAQWRAGVSNAIAEPAPEPMVYEEAGLCAECARRGLTCSTTKQPANIGNPKLIPLPIPFAKYKETGVYLEPGIAIMRPPTAQYLPTTYTVPDNIYAAPNNTYAAPNNTYAAPNNTYAAPNNTYNPVYGYTNTNSYNNNGPSNTTNINANANAIVNRWGTRDSRW